MKLVREHLDIKMILRTLYRMMFPATMIVIMAITLLRYGNIQDFKRRSSEHHLVVESRDIDSLEKALRGATFQDVKKERISDSKYRIVIRCPPDDLGSITGLIQRLGVKRDGG